METKDWLVVLLIIITMIRWVQTVESNNSLAKRRAETLKVEEKVTELKRLVAAHEKVKSIWVRRERALQKQVNTLQVLAVAFKDQVKCEQTLTDAVRANRKFKEVETPCSRAHEPLVASQVTQLQERIAYLHESNNMMESEIEVLEAKIHSTRGKLVSTTKQLGHVEEENEKMRSRVQETQAIVLDMESQFAEQLQQSNANFEQQVGKLHAELSQKQESIKLANIKTHDTEKQKMELWMESVERENGYLRDIASLRAQVRKLDAELLVYVEDKIKRKQDQEQRVAWIAQLTVSRNFRSKFAGSQQQERPRWR